MKCSNYFKMLALSLIVASCSSDEVPQPGIVTSPDGTAYLNMAFNLPTQNSGSRAQNDVFEDGIASEYQVNSAHLVTFIGTSESDAKLTEVIPMIAFQPWNAEGTPDQVTTRREVVQEIKVVPTKDQKIYAFILLNVNMEDEKIKGIFEKDKTISDIMDAKVSTLTGVDGGLIMMNAPLAFTSDGSTSVKTLVEIPADNIKPTIEEAQQEGTVEIYLERGVAKVTIGKHDAQAKFDNMPVDPDNSPLTVTLDSWAIDQTNKESYFARNIIDFDTWKDYNHPNATKRMIGNTRVYAPESDDDKNPYQNAFRIYWAKDPNYENTSTPTKDDLNRIKNVDVKNGWEDIVYPLENVNAISNQLKNNTTRLVFKASIQLKNNSAGSTVFQLATDGKIYSIDNLRNHITKIITYVLGEDTSVKLVDSPSFLTEAGSKLILESDLTGGDVTKEKFTTIQNNVGTITTYLDGVCYYTTPIKHFGDDLTPWNSATDPQDYSGTDGAEKWLGRYGVLRNNWYHIDVKSISTLGSATVPDPVNPDIPVDEKKYQIDITCNIFSWAKRAYEVGL